MKRNQIIITALVVMIAVAGYLNYADTRNSQEIVSIPLAEDSIGNPLIVDFDMVFEADGDSGNTPSVLDFGFTVDDDIGSPYPRR